MANFGHGKKYEVIKNKLLHSAAKLFLERGYHNTKIIDITKEANVDANAVARVFGDKDGLMAELVGYVLEGQFESTSKFLKDKTDDKILFYICETTLQLYMAESSEHIRELYVVAYSAPKSSNIIYNVITNKLEHIFKEHLPHLETKDFYELELASGGIMRSFLSVPCDKYFTMERKIKRFIETTLLVYEVPKSKIEMGINFVSQFDFKYLADLTIKNMLNYLKENALRLEE